MTQSKENRRSSDMSAAMEVSIRPIQCKVGSTSGYTLLVHADTYELILLSTDHELKLIDADAVPEAIKGIAADIQRTRNSRIPVETRIEPIKNSNIESSNGSVVRVTIAQGDKKSPHNLLLSHGEEGRIAPTLFDNPKLALVHAGEIIDIIGDHKVDWKKLTITDKSIKSVKGKKK